ncbi:MAG TPA: hypothetical protein VF450_05250 [Noviherbaspirillum sp.]
MSGSQEKNLSTEDACQSEAVNLSIAFVPRPTGQAASLALRKSGTRERTAAFMPKKANRNEPQQSTHKTPRKQFQKRPQPLETFTSPASHYTAHTHINEHITAGSGNWH